MLAIIVVMSLLNLKNTSFPIEDSTNISVQVTYPGAAPEEVEEGVILKIEEALKGVEGVKEITSTSRENFGSVNVEILTDYDIDEMVTEVKNGVDRISSFPVGAEKPIVFKILRKPSPFVPFSLKLINCDNFHQFYTWVQRPTNPDGMLDSRKNE